MEKRPRFEYAGQSSEGILAHVETHSLFSVLGGLQWCIQAKARVQGGKDKLSEEKRVFLAVMTLILEVNNGGYRQFFWNRSRQHAPIIVDSLRRIQGERTAELTARAIAPLHLREVTAERIAEVMQCENPERDAELEALSREFYSFHEATQQLLVFVLAERAHIQAPRTEDYPRFPKRNGSIRSKRLIASADELYEKTKPPTVDY